MKSVCLCLAQRDDSEIGLSRLLLTGNSIYFGYVKTTRFPTLTWRFLMIRNKPVEISDRIYLSIGTDAVDAALITKDLALKSFALDTGLPLSQFGTIGDSANDIPLLRIPNLGLVGAPNNAQSIVKQIVGTVSNSYVSRKDFLDGFVDFYERCIEVGIRHVFADRDGVLIRKWDLSERSKLKQIIERMGKEDRPFITIVTGSSYEQNIEFARKYGLNSGLCSNEKIRENPHFIYAENGAVQINILDGTIRSQVEFLNRDLLKTDFLRALLDNVEKRVLPAFDLKFGNQFSDGHSKIYLPPKETMVTLNIPVTHHGIDDYRRTPESNLLRDAILKEMEAVAQQLGLSYDVLGVN